MRYTLIIVLNNTKINMLEAITIHLFTIHYETENNIKYYHQRRKNHLKALKLIIC